MNEFKIIGEGPGTVNKQSYVVGNKIAPSLATKKRMIYGNEEGHWKTLGEIGLIGMLLYYFLHFRIIFLLSKLSLFGRKTYFLGVAACLFHVFTLWATYFQVLFVQFMVFGFSGIVLAILQENRHRKINNNIA